ncbi:hypothetical protein [Stygiolobus caldivivus]|uniref:Uncharacterized protein n=1 Tax=Stygiolobus caldivivus TaxID=2824673 RepID=A0A8D5ZK00_9CREN|nr:hypothetical protein [Stygiolobus caldivivus]BCU70727.1 hypothetical protein KN1_20240 [Stygiolobus caldivivus]
MKELNGIPPGINAVDYVVVLDTILNFETILENEDEVSDIIEKTRNFLFSSMKGNLK